MNNEARLALISIFKSNIDRELLLKDPIKLSGLLYDMCGNYRKEIKAILNARDEKIPEDLLALNDDQILNEIILNRLSQKILDSSPSTEDEAQWAVVTWALALDCDIPADLLKTETKRIIQKQEFLPTVDLSPMSMPEGPTLVVSRLGLGQYKNISEAITAAQPGTRILVRSGLYKEDLQIDKPLEIIGDGKIEEIVVEGYTCFTVKAGQVRISNLILIGKDKYPIVKLEGGGTQIAECQLFNSSKNSGCTALQMHGRDIQANITKCNISFSSSGYTNYAFDISVSGKSTVTVDSLQLKDDVRIQQGQSIVFQDTQIKTLSISGQECNPIFQNCQFNKIYISKGCQPEFIKCKVDSGVSIWGEGTVGHFQNSNISGSRDDSGVVVKDGANPFFLQCQIHNAVTSTNAGVLITENGEGIFEECEIYNNWFGANIKRGGNPTFRSCKINNNDVYGIYVNTYGAGLIEGCDLTSNKGGAWKIETGCPVRRNNNKE